MVLLRVFVRELASGKSEDSKVSGTSRVNRLFDHQWWN